MRLTLLGALLLFSGCAGDKGETEDTSATDNDRDGSPATEDCNDDDRAIHPGADELCNEVDDNCNGEVDESPKDQNIYYADTDGDTYGNPASTQVGCSAPAGFVESKSDCNDARADVHPGASEDNCADPIDYNCDGSTQYADLDGDTYPACEECDDTDKNVHPGASETCNDQDDDCDGTKDEDAIDVRTWHPDADKDGYGDGSTSVTACDKPSGYVQDARDCDDTNYDRNPGTVEICDVDGVDEDCNGLANDDDPDVDPSSQTTWYTDRDGDGYGDVATGVAQCDQPRNTLSTGGDCDDTDVAINPAATEVCDANGVDEDCDGYVDDADVSIDKATQSKFYRDFDGDNYGSTSVTLTRCDGPVGYISVGGDCNDSSSSVNPGATEVCDSKDTDEDCNSLADNNDPNATSLSTFYQDADGDGYGNDSVTTSACDAATGYVAYGSDCDDGNTSINPGASEICDASNTDEDCDGLADDKDGGATGQSTWYRDGDGDGYGDSTAALSLCDGPSGYITTGGDCQDGNSAVHPGQSEVCDPSDVDEDCSGAADNNDPNTVGTLSGYADVDGDGYGNASSPVKVCEYGSAGVNNSSDCNDSANSINPAAKEVCAAGDEDCDGLEGDKDPSVADQLSWFVDGDGDGYGSDTSKVNGCTQPGGTLPSGGDCNDADTSISPGNSEVCGDGVDQDCSGTVDDCGMVGSRSLSTAEVRYLGTVSSGAAGRDVSLGDGMVYLAGKPSGGGAVYAETTSIGDHLLSSSTWSVSSYSVDRLLYGSFDGISSELAVATSDGMITLQDPSAGSGSLSGTLLSLPSAATVTSLTFGEGLTIGVPTTTVGTTNNAGRAYILSQDTVAALGASSSLTSVADAMVEGSSTSERFGSAVASVDLNGDGFSDTLVGATGAVSTLGAVVGFLAPMSGTYALPDADASITGGSVGEKLGFGLTGAGDDNNDGYEDIWVGATGTNKVYLMSGGVSAQGISSALAVLQGNGGSTFGAAIAGGEDFDGDGKNDVAVGAPTDSASNGIVYVFRGPFAGGGTRTLGSAVGQFTGTGKAGEVLSTGDVDGDGYGDLLIGGSTSTGSSSSTGAAWLLFGTP